MTDAPIRLEGKRPYLVRRNDMPSSQSRELKINQLSDVMHSRSSGMIALLVEDESGSIDRIVMSGELAEKLHLMLGNALTGARQNPAAP